ncbi:glycerol dehydrogenase [Thiospirochaeta perfilievii]|uniref:Glycerol dehydrogenase n=1 Tax=Thiospirochaeta perfilievii TaxID=252967 RepID=A0A5C1Q842_9SPIO|nr:glycerol dehydrogenase [Thiospirochaeta perfilievii]QEN03498.1 glycerol dehydrogenase [Thiospirochaeta perfilievii]
MKKILISPSKYVQDNGALANLGEYVLAFGKKALLVASKDDQSRVQHILDEATNKCDFELIYGGFNLECTTEEVQRLININNENSCDVIIGLGGGKALDTAKAVSHSKELPVITIPTIASTDAPCSSLSVVYNAKGEFQEYRFYRSNPDLVLVDTGIISKAPTRFLIAGMGDALSTYFEARACERAFADNIPGGKSTKLAVAAAKLCYETLLEDSLKAIAASESNCVTQALENIIEANTLLSGMGFESSGLAAAHAIHNGLTALEETHKFFHGEKVAFGTLVHLVLENAPKSELDEVLSYCKSVGLPTCLGDLGVNVITDEKVRAVAELSCAENETIHNMPFKVTSDDVFAAIYTADKLGR